MKFTVFAASGFILTFVGIKLFLGWLHKKEIFDIPNERSSHQNPTPVGGGIVIASVSLALFFLYLNYSGGEIYWSYFIGALIVALISWLDDLRSVPVLVRFLCHSIAAVLIIQSFNLSDVLYLPLIGNITLGFLKYIFWFLWIVWMINAYNFMDGIDGIAGIQGLIAAVFWFITAIYFENDLIGVFSVILAASNLAFLVFNWQPAKIFMGDVGSAFLGYTFAVFPLFFSPGSNTNEGIKFLPFIGILFVWLFFFDTVRTFLLRLIQGEPFWKAHRRHIYQQFVIKGYPHQFVSLLYGIIALIICIAAVSCFYKNLIGEIFLLIIIAAVSSLLQIASIYTKSKNTLT